ncbi:MAG TPA: NADPH-dependent glutamate synthase [Clostridiales bacterium]|jgi:glutamate synthase (NADPH/NADH) small chain|nr:NADPH-dependent glutamate synthase [Clostridiales bacterium]
MANMQKDKTPMRVQDPAVRAKNWEEVALGYTDEEAANEATRCLNCRHKPCIEGCPVAIDIPRFISEIAKGNPGSALGVIEESSALAAVCGRVCPQETQCEKLCVRGIKGEPVAIGRLERYAAEAGAGKNQPETTADAALNGKKVAVVGSGPAGLTCASDLRRMGYEVTVFEALHRAGGVLTYGIPEFRLPKSIVENQVDDLRRRGVEFVLDAVVGRTFTIDELFSRGFEAIFIGTGAGLPGFLGIPGENSVGVMSANEFLTRINLMKAYDPEYDTPIKVPAAAAVVGGGNVAMDAARCALRLGAGKVYILYRRSEEEMPARREEIEHAKEEGVELCAFVNPVRVNADEKGNVVSVTCERMRPGELDSSGRRRPVRIPDSEFDIAVDTLIVAIGTSPNPLIRMTTPGIEANSRGCLVTKDDGVSTTRPGVFAGGDAVSGAATVILAMGAGKKAAFAIDEYIKNK